MRNELEQILNKISDNVVLNTPEALLKNRALLTTPVNDSFSGRCILHKAAQYGYLDIIKIILGKNPDLLNQTDKLNQTPLIWAASCGHKYIVKYLISLGANLNFATNCPSNGSEHNRTALHWAAENKHGSIVSLLVRARAVIDKLTLQNENFRAYLYNDKDLDVARALANDRALLTILDEHSILHKVVRHNCLDIVKIILNKNPDLLNQTDNLNQTPLIWAASCGHKYIVKYLISLGADLNFTTNYVDNGLEHGRTALDWAAAGGHSEISAMLQEASGVVAQENRAENPQTSVTHVSFLRAKKLNSLPEDFTWVNTFEYTHST
ncbi:ankyrin repeat domain-containing protein [bacterium]|nr:ankyrin repeat domain-containing protein [bacterium]